MIIVKPSIIKERILLREGVIITNHSNHNIKKKLIINIDPKLYTIKKRILTIFRIENFIRPKLM